MSVFKIFSSRLFPIVTVPIFRQSTGFVRNKAYESRASLKHFYPASNHSFITPTEVPQKPGERFNGFIPVDKIDFTYSRSSGPGGQCVHTNNSKVDMRFQVKTAEWLHPELREVILERNKNQINAKGYLILKSEKTRSLHLNKADCMERLRKIIRTADEPPPPGPTPDEIKLAQSRKDRRDRKRIEEKRRSALNRKISLGMVD